MARRFFATLTGGYRLVNDADEEELTAMQYIGQVLVYLIAPASLVVGSTLFSD